MEYLFVKYTTAMLVGMVVAQFIDLGLVVSDFPRNVNRNERQKLSFFIVENKSTQFFTVYTLIDHRYDVKMFKPLQSSHLHST